MDMLIIMMMTVSTVFTTLKHPLSTGITIIIMTLLVAMSMGVMLGTYWFSYILIIIMLSGMLVLIIYMASIASNEKFKSSIKMTMTYSAIIYMYVKMSETEWMTNENMSMCNSIEILSLSMMFNKTLYTLTITMVMYMLFSMITISSIVNIDEGPLRSTK